MDEQTKVVLLPAMEDGIITKFTLKSIGVNAQIKSKNGQRTGWVTLEVPTDRVLFVSMEDGTLDTNTIVFDGIRNIVKELTEKIETGLTEEGDW